MLPLAIAGRFVSHIALYPINPTIHPARRKPAKIDGALDTEALRGLPWLADAERLKGTKEMPGKGSNPVILEWVDDLDQWYPVDDVARLRLFVAHCMRIGAPLANGLGGSA
ncbi:hypothetical protein [Neoaquamicrobium sediminum]|uniref:hypothetical protein n=1 Tax=Neoaquamicrobium sediminum TaxID=1849104 RepID=UPI003BAD1DFC